MAGIIDHIGTIILSLSALIAAFFVLRSEIKKYLTQSRRDEIITLSRSELQNLLNESFELTTKMADLTEKKISIIWEINHISEKLINNQKMKIRQFASITETKIKNKFSNEFLVEVQKKRSNPLVDDIIEKGEVVYTSRNFDILQYNAISFINQGFQNAITVSLLSLKVRIYDLCQQNHFLSKNELQWEQYVKETAEVYAIDTAEEIKTLFIAHSSLDDYSLFELELISELKRFVSKSLNEARHQTELIEEEKNEKINRRKEITEEIQNIQIKKNNSIIDRYVKSKK